MKRTIPLMLVVCLCMTALFGCAAKQEILPEVVEALEIDDKEAAEVEKLFDGFDEAFASLGKNPTEKDFYEYAKAVFDLADSFYTAILEKKSDWVSDKINNSTDRDEKVKYADLNLGILGVFTSKSLLRSSLFDVELMDGTGEECAEAAFELVNECSNFFYGVPRITEEQLDSLG